MGDTKAITAHHLTTTPLPRVSTLSCSAEAAEGVSAVCKHRHVISSSLPWWLNCGSAALRTKCDNNNSTWWVASEKRGEGRTHTEQS